MLKTNWQSMNDKKINIAILGLGYVGLPLALEFGKKFMLYYLVLLKTLEL